MSAMIAALAGVMVLLSGCGPEPLTQAADEVGTEAQALPTSTNVFCPAGFSFDAAYRLCVSSTEAVGPFTQSMVSTCQASKSVGGGLACESMRIAKGLLPIVAAANPLTVPYVIGYNSTGWVVNDPSGLWSGCYACGYPNRTSTNGRGVTYSYSSVRSAAGPDGNYWLSTAGTSSFSL